MEKEFQKLAIVIVADSGRMQTRNDAQNGSAFGRLQSD
jgi:hypothetical protein